MSALQAAVLKGGIIVEGICLLNIANQIGLQFDCLIHVVGSRPKRMQRDRKIFDEVEEYLQDEHPIRRAHIVFNMDKFNDTASAIDLFYIKAKTIISILLALGGILSLLIGAFVLELGLKGDDTTLIKIAGAEISAKGIGGVILGTSVVWAFIAYLARPKYSQTHEVRESRNDQGAYERHEFSSSSTQAVRENERVPLPPPPLRSRNPRKASND